MFDKKISALFDEMFINNNSNKISHRRITMTIKKNFFWNKLSFSLSSLDITYNLDELASAVDDEIFVFRFFILVNIIYFQRERKREKLSYI